MKLMYKLLIVLLFVTFIPVMIIVHLLTDASHREIARDVSDIHKLTVINVAGQVKEFITDSRHHMIHLFEGVSLDEDDLQSRARLLKWGITEHMYDFRILTLMDPEGEFVLESQYLPEKTVPARFWRMMLVKPEDLGMHHDNILLQDALSRKTSVISPVYWNKRRNEPLITVTYPIYNKIQGNIRYVLAAEISLRKIQQFLSKINLDSVSNIYVVDSSGELIAGMPPAPGGIKTEFFQAVERFVDVLSPKTVLGSVEFFHNIEKENTQIIGAYSHLENLEWKIITAQPKKEAMAGAYTMRKQIFVFSSLTMLVALLCGVLFARNITKRVQRCVTGAHAIAKGDFDYKIDVKSKDEIGMLADTFNDMGASLKESREEINKWNLYLKKLVEDRTKELKKTQFQLIHTSKMTAIGQLGAGIAHEINNPLAGVLGQAQLLKRKLLRLDEDPRTMTALMKYINNIEKESKRCKVIISNLLKLSHKDESGIGLINLNEVLKNILILFENRLSKQNIALDLKFQENLRPIKARETQIQQVFMNLITNAYQAMPEGGTLTILTASNGAQKVRVDINDTGKGIAKENLDRIFEPFFTTKDIWSNTGLGLSVCYAIIREYGGTIDVDSTIGKGSRFKINFPAN